MIVNQSVTATTSELIIKQSNKANPQVGKFLYSYQPGIDENDEFIRSYLANSQIFEKNISIIKQINFNLPEDLEIRWMSCRNHSESSVQNSPANAFYNSRERNITLCYELFKVIAVLKINDGLTQEQAIDSTLKAYLFIMYHELGHALIDFLDIPITGKEEDAVDDFAAYMLLTRNESDQDAMIDVIQSAAITFYLLGKSQQFPAGSEHLLYWDEHSLGEQRFANLFCIILGSNPDKYATPLVADPNNSEDTRNPLKIPINRAQRCVNQEYPQKIESWTKLIIPHLIEEQRPWNGTGGGSNPAPANETPGGIRWGD
ncbi:DUF4344 domain-containing metallopeptidase [Gloeocapsa sp. PCC 73106]|uniref:DUF4344 domain-containing metallopeptidase n=1 Tax=Gloeocapsa sp. PCC 73106 TaxID=102232 RepID=UPI0002E89929|nr:DUF4344 domain-containing metallopeptidase [Gloeocapsa sp. PCC 73106]